MSVKVSVEEEKANAALVRSAQRRALRYAGEAHRDMEKAREMYEGAVLHAADLGCGPSAIGQAVGLSESTIRGFLRRRRNGES